MRASSGSVPPERPPPYRNAAHAPSILPPRPVAVRSADTRAGPDQPESAPNTRDRSGSSTEYTYAPQADSRAQGEFGIRNSEFGMSPTRPRESFEFLVLSFEILPIHPPTYTPSFGALVGARRWRMAGPTSACARRARHPRTRRWQRSELRPHPKEEAMSHALAVVRHDARRASVTRGRGRRPPMADGRNSEFRIPNSTTCRPQDQLRASFDVLLGGEATERQPNGGAGNLGLDAHRLQYVGNHGCTGVARRTS